MSNAIQPERRFYSADEVEVRVEDTDSGPVLIGSIPYNVWSRPMMGGRVRERFAPGAFVDDDLISTWEHRDELLLGRLSNGTLEIEESDERSAYRVQLPDTQAGRDVATLGKRGDLAGTSLEFFPDAEGEVIERRDGVTYVTVTKARRRQIGPVARPAYPQTTALVRSVERFEASLEADTAEGENAARAREREIELAEAEPIG